MNLIGQQLERQYPENAGHGVTLTPLHQQLTGDVRSPVMVILAAAAVVLLIACSNVANLVLARSVGRRRDIGIRLALGATRARIIRQFLMEGALLSSASAALGCLLAVWLIDASRAYLRQIESLAVAGLDQIAIDGRVLAFVASLAAATPFLFASVPGFISARSDALSGLREAGRGASFASRRRLRSALIAGEVALALVMLIGSGLLLKSYWLLMTTDPGFNASNLIVTSVVLPENRYKTDAAVDQFFDRLLRIAGMRRVNSMNEFCTNGCGRTGWQLQTCVVLLLKAGQSASRGAVEAVEIGALSRYDRPQPTLLDYDRLLQKWPDSGVIQ